MIERTEGISGETFLCKEMFFLIDWKHVWIQVKFQKNPRKLMPKENIREGTLFSRQKGLNLPSKMNLHLSKFIKQNWDGLIN